MAFAEPVFMWLASMADDGQHHGQMRLDALFAAEPDRLSQFTFEVAGLYFDWSKTHLDAETIDRFVARARDAGFAKAREALFAGEIVNASENRPATHVAERGSGAADDVATSTARRERMRALIDAVEAGAFGDITGLLHIGIGGSVLGPALLLDALGRRKVRLHVSFLSNVDGEAFEEAVDMLDPATTLIIVASKTMTTAETLANVDSALHWLEDAGVSDPHGRLIGVTARPEAAVAIGIDETRVLQFGEGVGGRYSLWSSVGVSAALALGWNAFEELLEGAAEMDRHFRFSEPHTNVPLIAAFADRYYVEEIGCQSRAVFPYDERLRLLPSYLQQLEMESNGKSTGNDASPLSVPSAPVTWGGTGTDAQHAVFQLLHQGTCMVPVEFIAVREGEEGQHPQRRRQLLLNAFAQGTALMRGNASDDPQRALAGNRPSATILLDQIDPRTLGALLAFYEHRTFANAAMLGINPFDQWGVELGKEIARRLGGDVENEDIDPSTRALMDRAGI